MAKRISTNAPRAITKTNGCYAKSAAASALTQSRAARSDRTVQTLIHRPHSSADELGLRAWKTTYRNSRSKG